MPADSLSNADQSSSIHGQTLHEVEGNLRTRLQYAAKLLSMVSHADLAAAAWIWYDASGKVCTVAQLQAYSIGRNPWSSIHINDPRVSRKHAIVFRDQHLWQLRKLSLNGSVCVNGRPVDTAFLSRGDLVQIGPTALVFLGDHDPDSPLIADG